jgi:hypothetical protein
MAVFRVQVHYKFGATQKWSNVWHVDAATLLTAATEFEVTAVPILLPLLHPSCSLDRLLVSDPATSQFTVNTINEFGTSADSGDLLPLFNCVKVIIPTAGFGRPDLKYLKGFLTETLIDGDVVEPTAATGIDNQLTAMITDMAAVSVPLCTEEGEGYTNVSVQSLVQMRQMHRKRRKTPVAP